ncbi:hypothetical protein GDO86_012229, partial [Hymenochirus boettgeri]
MEDINEEEDYIDDNIFHVIQVICILCYSITFILGIAGNGLVIWIAGFRMKKMVNIIWFLNLAVADFTFNIFFPLQITELAMEGHWPFGQIMCKVIFTVLHLNMYVSTFFLMVISIDRCTSVLCPVWSKNRRTSKLAIIISVVIWLTCLVLSSPFFAFYDIKQDDYENRFYCYPIYAYEEDIHRHRYKVMLLVKFVVMFLIPFTFILFCYLLILIRVRRRQHILGSERTFRVVVTIVLCFFICWFPFHFLPLLEFMNVPMSANMEFVVLNISCCLAFFNSCLNPIVYVFIGRDFKKRLIRSLPSFLENTFRERC